MNAFGSMFRSLVASLVVLLGLVSWHHEAQALDFSDLVTVLKGMDQYNVNPFPVKGQELAGAKELFDCLAGGSNVLGCLDTHKNDDFVKKFGGVNLELPPWLDNLVSAYVAIKNNDFWGVVGPLGEAAVCVIAQVMAAGLDLCGLIKDLIAVGEALLDAATAIGQFFADIGGGFYDAVACGIFGDCGSGPPPEQTAYNCFFAARVKPDGLKAMEAVDASEFAALRGAIVAKAKAGGPCPAGQIPQYWKADPPISADKAAEIYTYAVEGAWSADVMGPVLAARDKKRIEYTSAQQISAWATAATAQYEAKKASPKLFIFDGCTEDFRTKFGFAHVDRWLTWRQSGKSELQQKAMKLNNVTSNRFWCEADFFGKNLDKFTQQFRNYVQSHYCPLFGQELTCTTIARYEQCVGLMGSVNQADQCRAAVASIGNEIAKKIAASFQSGKGASFTSAPSKYACQIVLPDGGAPTSNKPVDFLCTRPTQQHFCDKEYHVLWKSSIKVVNCVTPPNLIPAPYGAQMQKVKQAVASLQTKFPSVGIDKYDPLLVSSGKLDVWETLKKAEGSRPSSPPSPDDVKFSFLASVSESIDGVSRPTFVQSVLVEKPELAIVPPSLKAGMVKPGDPDPFTKPAAGAAQPALTAKVAPAAAGAVAGAIAAQGAAAAGQQSQVMSGPAPGGTATRGTASTPATASTPPTTSLPQGSQLPAVQARTPAQTQLPAVQSRAQTSLPAVQSPPPATRAPSTGSAGPNWGALGGQAGSLPPPAQMPAPATGTAPLARAANVAPNILDAATERALAAASCTRSAGASGLRFTCANRAGFDRCEALRRQNKVEQCTLNEQR